MAFVCEICGGTEIIKQEGTFVCQGCGMKYSAEEVRKMIAGGTIDVSGSTVKVDSSSKLNNLRQLARRARENDDDEAAGKYYEQIVLEDPNDWEASFYSVFYPAMNIKVSEMASGCRKVTNALDTTFSLIKEHVSDDLEQKKACEEIHSQVIRYGVLIMKNFENIHKLDEFVRVSDAWDTMFLVCGDCFQKYFGDIETAASLYNSVTKHDSKDRTREVVEIAKKRLAELKKKNAEKYWIEHAEEKDKLEKIIKDNTNEIEVLNQKKQEMLASAAPLFDQINELKNTIEAKTATLKRFDDEIKQPTRSENEIAKIRTEIDRLKTQLSSLGIFKGREKKALQEEIEKLTNKQALLKNNVAQEIEEVKSRMNELKKPVQDAIDALNSQIDALKTEVKAFENQASEIQSQIDKMNAQIHEAQTELDADHSV